MKMEFTDGNIRTVTLAADEKEKIIRDTKCPELCLRVRASSKKFYGYVFFHGKIHRPYIAAATGPDAYSISAARTAARALAAQIRNDAYTKEEKKFKNKYTVENVYQAWLEWSAQHPDDPAAHRQGTIDAHYSFSSLGPLRIEKITHEDIENYRTAKINQGNKNASINRWLREVKFLARWAYEHKLIPCKPDHRFMSSVKELDSVPKTSHFTSEERNALLAAAKKSSERTIAGKNMAYIYVLVQILLRTGIRPQTALGLRWDDIALDQSQIRIRAANIKTKKDAWKMLSPQTVEILEEWKKKTTGQPTDTIFPGDGRTIHSVKKQIKNIFAAAGMEQYSAYSMRHDYASELLAAGAEITDVQLGLIHADPRTTMKYAHPAAARMKKIEALLDSPSK